MRYAPAARIFLAAGVVLAALRAVGVVIFTRGLAAATTAFFGHTVITEIPAAVGGLAIMVVAQWAADAFAVWSGGRVTAQLRSAALSGYRGSEAHSTDVVTLLGSGIDAVSTYIVSFLPAAIASLVVTPIIAAVIWFIDPLSGIAIAVTIPLIPLFMVLIGKATQATQTAQWSALSRLSVGFSEVVAGLSTLILFGREKRQSVRIRSVTNDYRESTMKVLRLAFLSRFALEVAASLSIAVVAVSIGLRLVNGSLHLFTGLWVLILVPEVFIAIRLVGARFHASADGITVANSVFDVIESTQPPMSPSEPTRGDLRIDSVAVPGRLAPVTSEISSGALTVVTGPSGVGKSTLIAAILGQCQFVGVVTFGDDPVSPRSVSWAPQSPALVGHSVADAITLGSHGAVAATVLADARRLAAVDVDDSHRCDSISGGQAQRVSLARAYYRALTRDTPIVIADEPTSALDGENEAKVVAGLREFAGRGYTVIVASHRPSVVAAADKWVEVTA